MAKILESALIRHKSYVKVSDEYQIDVDKRAFAIDFFDNIPVYFFSRNNHAPLISNPPVDSPSGILLITQISLLYYFPSYFIIIKPLVTNKISRL